MTAPRPDALRQAPRGGVETLGTARRLFLVNHGGSDAGPTPVHDFSSNASALAAPPALLQAVLAAERQRYPDPAYTALREQLAQACGLDAARVLPCAGGAEAIRRLSLAALLAGINTVWVPQPGFGDYAAAAQALGLRVRPYSQIGEIEWQAPTRALVWLCEPCNPTGASLSAQDWQDLTLLQAKGAVLAIDQAYEPLRLEGVNLLPAELAQRAWRLHCPNKALSLTGVRAAYLLAPADADDILLPHAWAVAPSWVLSSEGCALLQHWLSEPTAQHLSQVKTQLRQWRDTQARMLAALGWTQAPSCSNFWLARPPAPLDLAALRQRGIKLRDASSFGLPGWLRLSTQNPAAQQALLEALTP